MWWYRGICGTWRKPESIERIDGTYDREKAFAEAQAMANRRNETVTVSAERGSANGLIHKFYEVKPEGFPSPYRIRKEQEP